MKFFFTVRKKNSKKIKKIIGEEKGIFCCINHDCAAEGATERFEGIKRKLQLRGKNR